MKVTLIKIKHYHLKNYTKLNRIKPNLKDIIDNLEKSDTWKIQSIIANDFISSIDNEEGRVMHSKSDNIEVGENRVTWCTF